MGLIQGLLGNASKASIDDFKRDWGSLFGPNEEVQAAYKLVRDWVVFTDKRFIYIDIQGMLGKKISVNSIPYRQIVYFGVQCAGIMDLNADLL